MADIFISYGRKDRKIVETIAARLQREGWTTWWDRSLSAGQRWDETIRRELAYARCVLVLWSRHSWASKWVQAEAHAGFERDALVAGRIDNVRIEPPFNIVQTTDLLPGELKTRIENLVQGLRLKLGGVPPAYGGENDPSWALPPLQGEELDVRVVWQPTGYVLVRRDDGTLVKDRRSLSQDELAKVPPDAEPCRFSNFAPNRGGELQSCIIAGADSEVFGSERAFWWALARTKVLTTSAMLYGAGIRGDKLAYVSVAARSMWESALEQHPIEEMRDLMIFTRNIHLKVISDCLSEEDDENTRIGLHIAMAMVLATQSEDHKLEGVAYRRFKKYLWAPGDEPVEFTEHDDVR